MIPHLAVPLRLRGGRAVTVEQDSIAETLQHATVLLRTRIDDRPAFPGYGIPDPTQLTTIDEAVIADALANHVPPIDATLEEGDEVDVDVRTLRVIVAGEGVATLDRIGGNVRIRLASQVGAPMTTESGDVLLFEAEGM